MIRRPPRSTQSRSSAASDVYKRQLKALRPAIPSGLAVETVDTHALDELTGSRDHQGVALQVDAFAYATADEVLGAEIVVVLDEVSDPRNLGAAARSALAAGAGG